MERKIKAKIALGHESYRGTNSNFNAVWDRQSRTHLPGQYEPPGPARTEELRTLEVNMKAKVPCCG